MHDEEIKEIGEQSEILACYIGFMTKWLSLKSGYYMNVSPHS